jgi:hypothetical protein
MLTWVRPLTSHSSIAGDGQVQFYAKENTRFDRRSGIAMQHQGADLFVNTDGTNICFSCLRCWSQHSVRYTTADTNASQYTLTVPNNAQYYFGKGKGKAVPLQA